MEFLRPENGEDAMLVNPNPNMEFQCRAWGKDYVFPPMKKYMVPRRLANELITQAEEAKNNRLMQWSAEKNEHLRLMGRADPGAHMKARDFVGEDGQPKTQLWPRPPLVNLHQEQGQKLYAEAVRECKKLGIKIPDEDAELPKAPVGITELVRPKKEWEKPKLMKWLEENGVMHSGAEDQAKMLKKATQCYENMKAKLNAVGVNVVDPEETQGDEEDAVIPVQG
jgi:hypothetical protein